MIRLLELPAQWVHGSKRLIIWIFYVLSGYVLLFDVFESESVLLWDAVTAKQNWEAIIWVAEIWYVILCKLLYSQVMSLPIKESIVLQWKDQTKLCLTWHYMSGAWVKSGFLIVLTRQRIFGQLQLLSQQGTVPAWCWDSAGTCTSRNKLLCWTLKLKWVYTLPYYRRALYWSGLCVKPIDSFPKRHSHMRLCELSCIESYMTSIMDVIIVRLVTNHYFPLVDKCAEAVISNI